MTFSREDLVARARQLLARPLNARCVSVVRFEQDRDDFLPGTGGEQELIVRRAPRSAFSDALEFWVVSEAADDWTDRESYLPFIAGAPCLPLTAAEVDARVASRLGALRSPPPAPGRCITGMQMYRTWDQEIVLAIYPTEYLSFTWETYA